MLRMTEEFELKNRDGKRMPVTLHKPAGEVNGTFVMLHGLGGWKDQEVVTASVTAAVECGYQALTFDAADGAMGPDGDFFTSTNTGYVKDVEDVMQWMNAQPWCKGPVVLGGHSQGGLVALHYAARNPEGIDRLLLVAPAVAGHSGWWMYWPRALVWIIRGRMRWTGPHGKRLWLSRTWLFDSFNFDGYRDAKRIKVPVLIVSAGADHTVGKPFIHANLTRHFTTARHETIPRSPHAFCGFEPELADIVASWLTSS